MAAQAETETTVSGVQSDGYYLIGTNRPKHLNKLHKEPRAHLVRTVGEWTEYRVKASDFDPLTGFKRRVNLSDEQRQAIAARLAK